MGKRDQLVYQESKWENYTSKDEKNNASCKCLCNLAGKEWVNFLEQISY